MDYEYFIAQVNSYDPRTLTGVARIKGGSRDGETVEFSYGLGSFVNPDGTLTGSHERDEDFGPRTTIDHPKRNKWVVLAYAGDQLVHWTHRRLARPIIDRDLVTA